MKPLNTRVLVLLGGILFITLSVHMCSIKDGFKSGFQKLDQDKKSSGYPTAKPNTSIANTNTSAAAAAAAAAANARKAKEAKEAKEAKDAAEKKAKEAAQAQTITALLAAASSANASATSVTTTTPIPTTLQPTTLQPTTLQPTVASFASTLRPTTIIPTTTSLTTTPYRSNNNSLSRDAAALSTQVQSVFGSSSSFPSSISSSPYLLSSEDLRGKTADTPLYNQFTPQYPAPDFRSWKPSSSTSNVFGREYGDSYENKSCSANINNYYINSTVG